MKLRYQLKYLILVPTIGICACKKVINVNLNNASPAIVIEGNISNEAGLYQVKLTSSISYTNDNIYPGVTGAIVSIKDDSTGITDILTENYNGNYLTNKTIGAVGHTYHLYVKSNGKEYTATSTMPQQVMLDSITFLTNSGFGEINVSPQPNFQDPGGVYNAYEFLETYHGVPSKRIFVLNDEFSDGRYVVRPLRNDSTYIQSGDEVQLEMRCIDKNIFNYLKELSRQDPTNGQPTSPANPISNINNGALGYFSAHTTQKKKAIYH